MLRAARCRDFGTSGDGDGTGEQDGDGGAGQDGENGAGQLCARSQHMPAAAKAIAQLTRLPIRKYSAW